ncbi:hypothetical protein [Marinobacter nauticus]|uniref:Uncharacterized protein n=1 Tax=Marinobacter nauticus (strain ATCC 700491 / DSM 11845 / VT8) TaxID=351348 RepID=A1TYC9_MARN8|nr:hypothetical protein [Marinobacter nauticus]ABM17748.1 hypothetical protein Maqu_0650 [Marinobacter nauticus VT8]
MSVASLIARKLGQPVTPVTRRENTGVTAVALGREGRNPCNPCNPTKTRYTEKKPEPVNPDALLNEIARTLQSNPARLRALLDSDDMQDIAEGATSRANLLAYFRLMRSHGHPLADDTPEPTRQPESRPGHVELMQAWKPAHDELINHLMACKACYAPRARYCTEGADLRRVYLESYTNSTNPTRAKQ